MRKPCPRRRRMPRARLDANKTRRLHSLATRTDSRALIALGVPVPTDRIDFVAEQHGLDPEMA